MSVPTWQLDDFVDRLDAWVANESPEDDLRLEVTAWVFTRAQDPYQGARRADGFANLWYCQIPYTAQHEGRVVPCSFWVEEADRVVRCDSIATLRPPF